MVLSEEEKDLKRIEGNFFYMNISGMHYQRR